MSSKGPNATFLSSEWGRRENELVTLKLHESYRELHERTAASWRQIRYEQRQLGQQPGPGYYARLCDGAIVVLRELLGKIDEVCREVQSQKRGSVNAAFIRSVLLPKIFEAIEARNSSIRWELERVARRTRFRNLTPALRHLARAINHVKGGVSNKYEIEIRELELRARSTPQGIGTQVVESFSEISTLNQLTQNPTKVKSKNQRKSLVMPILRTKGWSILDWAMNSGVDFHTANDYLNAKTKPYSSTRKKLAEALGVEVNRLPK